MENEEKKQAKVGRKTKVDTVGKPIPFVPQNQIKINSDKKIDDLQKQLFETISGFTKDNECSIFEIFEAMSRVSFAYNKRFLTQYIDDKSTK